MTESLATIRKRAEEVLKANESNLGKKTFAKKAEEFFVHYHDKEFLKEFTRKLNTTLKRNETTKTNKKARAFEANRAHFVKVNDKKKKREIVTRFISKKAIPKLQQTAGLRFLNSNMFVINTPKDPAKCKAAVEAAPVIATETWVRVIHNAFPVVTSLEDIRNKITDLYEKQRNAFKMTILFGYVFEKMEEQEDGYHSPEYAVFRPYNKDKFLEAGLVRNRQMLNTILDNNLTIEKVLDWLATQQTDSSVRMIGIHSMIVKIYKMEMKIGARVEIPKYISQNQNFVNPDTSNNLCFWTCLAYHQTKQIRCLKRAKELYEEFYQSKPTKDYTGFDINEIEKFEEHFKLGVNIFELNEKNKPKSLKKAYNEDNVINLLLYTNHFVYISRIDVLDESKYVCDTCGLACRDRYDLNRHFKAETCTKEKVENFVKYPEVYEPPRNPITQLNERFNTDCDILFEPFIVYDKEAIVIKESRNITKNFSLNNRQQAVSVSICSNIDGYTKPHCIVESNVKELYRLMFEYLKKVSEKGVKLMEAKFKPLFDEINKVKDEDQQKKYLNQLNRYVDKVPVLGFNSGKYDINLSINEFMTELTKLGNISSIKAGNTYKSIQCGNMQFLDMCQYLPPAFSLDKYIKAFNPNGCQKSVFPYEFVDSYEKLNCDINTLTRDNFYSSLKNKGISNDEWVTFEKNKEKYNWRTVEDLLIFYNNLDVQPFLEAILNHRQFFTPLGIDMFKDGMSLPALAEKIMFGYELQEFNETYKHETITPCKYKDFTNWKDKKQGYITQDKNSGRYDKNAFISHDEVLELTKKQSGKCLYCHYWLNDEKWTLDRIDNELGHNSGNCVLACVTCNKYRSDQNFNEFKRKQALFRYARDNPMIHLIDEANKEVFQKLRDNIVGGPSIVFHRYHEADKTTIQRPVYDTETKQWELGKKGNLVKNVTGYDANALYLWCIGNEMPCGKLKYVDYIEGCDFEYDKFIKNFFGFVEVDIHTPEELKNYFAEFPPIFKNASFANTDGKIERKLISSFKGEKVLIKSCRLKWLIEKGMVVTKIHGYIECQKGRPFHKFMEKVSDERRKGDIDPDHAIIAEMWKLVGNSAFGRTGMNKKKFSKTVYGNEDKYNKEVCSYLFKDANEYGKTFEITKSLTQIKQDIPIQVACSIYDDAKLKMTQFYYDCIDKFIDRDDFQYIQMDTDSAYMAFSGDFKDIIKPSMRDTFEKEKYNWFLRDDTKENLRYSKRTAGLFKPEWVGSGMVSLTSKVYFGTMNEESNDKPYIGGKDEINKCSAKGTQKSHNADKLTFNTYLNILKTGESVMVKNKGMRIMNDRQVGGEKTECQTGRAIYGYEVTKVGLTDKYNKRQVMNDRITTYPLDI